MGHIIELGLKKMALPRKYKKDPLLPREIEKFRTKHPEDGDGFRR